MNKIGWGQLGIALSLSRIFAEAANFPHDDITYGMQRFTVITLSFVLLAAVLIPIMVLVRKCPNENIFVQSPVSQTLAVIFIFFIFTMMTTVTVQLEFYTSSTIFDASPAWLIILFVLIICLYALFKGLSATVRTGVIAAGCFIILLILIIFGIGESVSLHNLYPALIDTPETLISDVLREFSKNIEIVTFAALYPRVRSGAGKSLTLYFCLTFPALLIMTFLYNTVLGEYLDITSFPFYMLASLSDVSLFQRLDGIDVIVWVMAAIIRLSLLTLAVENVCLGAFKNKRLAKTVAACVLILSGITALFFSRNTVDFTAFANLTGTGLALLIPAAIIPLLCFILNRHRKERTE